MRHYRFILLGLLVCSISDTIYAQQSGGVVISENSEDQAKANAILDVRSSEKGLMIPHWTNSQRTSFVGTSEDEGLMVYDTGDKRVYVYDSTNQSWKGSGSYWSEQSGELSCDGFVGVGIDNPNYRLHVYEPNNGLALGVASGIDHNAVIHIGKKLGGNNLWSTIGFKGAGESILRLNNSSSFSDNHVTIDRSGNFGVGVGDPSTRLHIRQGNPVQTGASNARTVARFENDDASGAAISILSNTGASAYSGIFFGNQTKEENGVVKFNHSTEEFSFHVDATTLAVLKDGGLGIGATSPTANVHINQVTASSNPLIKMEYAWDKPNAIELNRGSHNMVKVGQGGGSYPHGYLKLTTASDANGVIQLGAAKNIASYIDAGNFGVGTQSPAGKIHSKVLVKGHATVRMSTPGTEMFINEDNDISGWVSYRVVTGTGIAFGDSDTPLFAINTNSDKVGVGTNYPARKLHVTEAMRLEPTTTAPSSPSMGDMYMHDNGNGTGVLKIYDGAQWQNAW